MVILKRLEGRSALVTGAGRGVGKGIALELAREGCRVAVNYFSSAESADETVAEIKTMGVEAFAIKADVSSAADVRDLISRVVARFGSLQILVNNAGVQTWSPLLEVSEAEWDQVIDTNLKGTFLCLQSAALHMKDHGGGAIVNIGSGCNKLAFPKLVAYTASKGGIEMLTKVAAVELGAYGIRVNCVAPGAIEIERTQLEHPEYARVWSEITPLGRVGTSTDVGQAVAYMVSDESSFVSGQTLWVDGAVFTKASWPYGRASS